VMHDMALPGLPVQLIQCPFCEKLPAPEDVYPHGATRRWEKLLETADKDVINNYLVNDRAFFRHGTVNGGRCPVDILPGPALNGVSPSQAGVKAADLMRLLGLR